MKHLTMTLITVLLLAACVCAGSYDSETMGTLGGELTILAEQVDNELDWQGVPPGPKDKEAIKKLLKDQPGLLEPFRDYELYFQRIENKTIVLVCSSDGDALLEDDASIAGVQCNPWKVEGTRCAFSSELSVCP